jgi:hypothetical protein
MDFPNNKKRQRTPITSDVIGILCLKCILSCGLLGELGGAVEFRSESTRLNDDGMEAFIAFATLIHITVSKLHENYSNILVS